MKIKKLVLLCAVFYAFQSCKKTSSIISQSKETCEECTQEMYVSPNHSKGEVRKILVNGEELQYTRIDGLNVFEGDILLSNEDLKLDKSGNQTKGTITTLSNRIWPNNTVYYSFANNILSNPTKKQKILAAIAHWALETNINFVPAIASTANRIVFRGGSGCSSPIGMKGGNQRITVGGSCSTGNIIHEIGHAIGMFHEHTRTNRGEFVTINTGNIQQGRAGNFVVCSNCGPNTPGAMDFGSIMMYDSFAFSSNGLPTITRIDGTTFTVQRNNLSNGDLTAVALSYP